ncbi:uncharacterized protein LOC124169471 [Ischnura elegans]|uniref:uncharacterized protein LOC124169471 n=1 Tax=Ischnura elegans TaxID=197161 RepID=UPI001ED87626|nr:uncharacterized protein LOC124169471 [Ischnura elegans]
MFRKKPNIPPRPLPPTTDQIEEDLDKVSVDDVVFALFEQVKSKDARGSEEVKEEIADIQIKSTDADTVYRQVKRLVEANKDLKNLLVVLTDKSAALQSSKISLKEMEDEIRHQSLEALK